MQIAAPSGLLVSDSVTKLGDPARGRVVVSGSHCGVYAAYLAARAGARGVVLNDASVGRDAAGIGGLAWLAELGIPAAAIDYRTARIGDGADTLARGVVSHVNAVAHAFGCTPGQSARECAAQLVARASPAPDAVPTEREGRYAIRTASGRCGVAIWAIDSISLLRADDAGAVVLAGSHGGLLGGDPATALRFDALAAAFNDAGGGMDGAGYTRLPVLDARGIAAVTVAARSARIGDGRSTHEDGIVSRCNRAAEKLGAKEGMPAAVFVDIVVTAAHPRKGK